MMIGIQILENVPKQNANFSTYITVYLRRNFEKFGED